MSDPRDCRDRRCALATSFICVRATVSSGAIASHVIAERSCITPRVGETGLSGCLTLRGGRSRTGFDQGDRKLLIQSRPRSNFLPAVASRRAFGPKRKSAFRHHHSGSEWPVLSAIANETGASSKRVNSHRPNRTVFWPTSRPSLPIRQPTGPEGGEIQSALSAQFRGERD